MEKTQTQIFHSIGIGTTVRPTIRSNRGLVLIEILVATFLMALMLMAVNIGTGNNLRNKLDQELDQIERAIRFAVNEAILKGGLARVHFFIDRSPVEFAVETGPADGLALPDFPRSRSDLISSEEQLKRQNTLKKIDREFEIADELKEGNFKFDEDIRLIGMGKSNQNYLINDYNASLYIYPSGEKDDFIIIIGNDEEVAALIIEPFSTRTSRKYQEIEYPEDAQVFDGLVQELQDKIARGLFEEWKRF